MTAFEKRDHLAHFETRMLQDVSFDLQFNVASKLNGLFIEEALLQQLCGNEALRPHCQQVTGWSSRHCRSWRNLSENGYDTKG